MIGKLRGLFAGESESGHILIEVGGVGYIVRVTPDTAEVLARKSVAEIELFIHTAVREDAIDLYGFATAGDLSFFKLLLSVSGIGPKTALGILTVADVVSLSRAIAQGDATALTKIYGIGKKNAERLVVELKDKLLRQHEKSGAASSPHAPADADVIAALEGLGYSASESRDALRSVALGTEGLRERLAAALKHLGTPARSL